MKSTMNSRFTRLALGSAIPLMIGAGVWYGVSSHSRHSLTPTNMVYTSHGYGGFVPKPVAASKPMPKAPQSSMVKLDPVQPLLEDYNAGRFASVETGAAQIVTHARNSPDVAAHEQSAQAYSLLAYAAARQHNLALARSRFETARLEAAKLPDKGVQPTEPGMPAPTLEEDAAYEHAVCTGALGHAAAAESEYMAFMRRYPESPLVQVSIKRIARLHGGDVPGAAEAVWRQAGQIAMARQKARQREASLCGPECLAELLRRRGGEADVHALATAMGVTDQGASMEALAEAAQKRGYNPSGLSLTVNGLLQQKFPLIALIAPGHYVIVDSATPALITVWDPDLHGIGHGGAHIYPISEWTHVWRGTALALAAVPSAPQI
ncbi:hypothetical protein CCAX7_007910 [Capsulimonas corticalis]|uniref:Uncharacterized protein n=1 Tax=Capsulimonas corticalis TaxID=2219043 RepID=A0A402CTT7_9BACT|nr:cysteine peptidase family C39 domain-containing protein [Capsulimonas corticalis]BDI28740.1 hypothetical protein CCAX7_007910 [Capsulimonas corticalis]